MDEGVLLEEYSEMLSVTLRLKGIRLFGWSLKGDTMIAYVLTDREKNILVKADTESSVNTLKKMAAGLPRRRKDESNNN